VGIERSRDPAPDARDGIGPVSGFASTLYRFPNIGQSLSYPLPMNPMFLLLVRW
jgi:hypothetical protein